MEKIKVEEIKKPGEQQTTTRIEPESTVGPKTEVYEGVRVEAGETEGVEEPSLMERVKEGAKHMTESVKETATGLADRLANVVGFGSAEEAKERTGEKYEEAKESAKEKLEQGKQKAGETWEQTKEKAGETLEQAKEKAQVASDRTKEGVEQAKQKAGETWESAKDRTRSAYEQGKESSGLAWERTKGTAHEAGERTKEGYEEAKQRVGEAYEESKEKSKEKPGDVSSGVHGASITTTYKSI